MGLFKSKAASDLDMIMQRIDMNMSNNYKDAAQMNYKELMDAYAEAVSKGGLKPKEAPVYEAKVEEYGIRLKGYTHKDQQPYWH